MELGSNPPHRHWEAGEAVSRDQRECTNCMHRIITHVMNQNDLVSVYRLTVRTFRDAGLGSVQRRGDSLYDVVNAAFDENNTLLRFGYRQWPLSNDDLVREALIWLEQQAIERGYSTSVGPDVWYDITRNLIQDLIDDPSCGITLAGLFNTRFSNSILQAAKFLYPDYQFMELRFRKAPSGALRNDHQVRLLISYFEEEHGIVNPDDWYRISSDDVETSVLSSVFAHRFASSLISLMRFTYPEFSIEPWRFGNVPSHFWSSSREQVAFLNSLVNRAGLESPMDLLQTERIFDESFEDFSRRIGGSGGLVVPEQSGFRDIFDLISINFYQFELYPWYQSRCNDFWVYLGNVRWYLEWLFARLDIDLDDAESMALVDTETIRLNYGRGLLSRMTYSEAVIASFPELGPWDPTVFDREIQGIFRPRRQRLLYHHLRQIFPESTIEYNFLHPEIRNPRTNRMLELDIYIEELGIAFEYSPASTHSEPEVIERDQIKVTRCAELGIDLFVLDESWDGTIDIIRNILSSNGYNV